MKYIIALDQGTTSSRAILFDETGKMVAARNKEFAQIYPQPGWIEHDPYEILSTQTGVMQQVVRDSGVPVEDIAAVGITNQRETTMIWERETGRPVYNAIVWQCRRTAPLCERLAAEGYADVIREKTGLLIDPYFAGTKIRWILDNVPGVRERAEAGELAFGTVETWLIWNLTQGKVHATDYTNASRTLLFNIYDLRWDEELLRILDIPASLLPDVKPCDGDFGMVDEIYLGREIPICGVLGDQHAALLGQACLDPGMAKTTYGTGCFLLTQTGEKPVRSKHNLLTTIAWGMGGKVDYALEGSIFMGGASVQWLRDELRIIDSSAESEEVASQVADTGGVYLVPAFTGLGAPWWDMYARGTLVGMTRGTGRAHIVRATLEAIAYQTRDVLDAMEQDAGYPITVMKADGGASANNLLMQFQSDILNMEVYRPRYVETTGLGAAYMAGIASGVWESADDIRRLWKVDRVFSPAMDDEQRDRKYKGWRRAVGRACHWLEGDE